MSVQAVEEVLSVGLDTGGTELKAAIGVARDGEPFRILERSFIGVPSEVTRGPAHVTGEVASNALLASLKAAGDLQPRHVRAAVMDFPCATNAADGVTLDVANMAHRDWLNFGVRASLRGNLPRLVAGFNPEVLEVENDGAATLAGVVNELPQSERHKRILGYFIGTGLGGAILINGVNPFNNVTGGTEPGATQVVFDEGPILLGHPASAKLRRLEDYVSIVALERQIPLLISAGLIPSEHPLLELQGAGAKSRERVQAESLLRFAVDAFGRGAMDDFSLRPFLLQREVLGIFLQDKIQSLRPDHIFIGGGVTDSRRVTPEFARWYVDGVREVAINSITQPARRQAGIPEFHIPRSGDFAAPIGAATIGATLLENRRRGLSE